MVISFRHRLAFLAMPRAASSAIERVLAPRCEIVAGGEPALKHMTVQRFAKHFQPLARDYGIGRLETACLFRHPVDWLASWYRYRQRKGVPDPARSTAGLDFEGFVEGYLADPQPEWARVGRPARFVGGLGRPPRVDHIFRYEHFDAFAAFLSARFGEALRFDRINASHGAPVSVDGRLRARIEAAMDDEMRIWHDIAR
ncbi:MAG: hypothetical protein D6754_08860 [Alphaproteobacteria bacterium]|nr:MAG: hypothetical protein D6754_08860 [Alphaproteobacteria bacterium]